MKSRRTRVVRSLAVTARNGLLALGVIASAITAAPTRLTLEQANVREGPDFTPAMVGRDVVAQGLASMKPLSIVGMAYLPIQDSNQHGLLLMGPLDLFKGLSPGDAVEARGTMVARAGLPVLSVAQVRRTGSEAPPPPRLLKIGDVASLRYLGTLVAVEGNVSRVGENSGGWLLTISDSGRAIDVFLPRTKRDEANKLSGYRQGDRVRATGIANQYNSFPPYDGSFQIVIPDSAAIALLRRAWLIPPALLLSAVGLIVLALAGWWVRERWIVGQRKRLWTLNSLGEEVIAATSPAEILRKLTTTIPKLTSATGVNLYLFDRGSNTLESVLVSGGAEAAIKVDSPTGAVASGVALCFRNRTSIAIPDTRRSPLFKTAGRSGAPRAVMFVPMLAQTELLGVLEIEYAAEVHSFKPEEEAATQHLANQIAIGLRLQDQQAIREQLFRSEKLAAAGQLISGVANELQAPLDSIVALTRELRSRQIDAAEPELESIGGEALRASEIVARLVSFGRVEKAEAQPVDVGAIMVGLLRLRAREWEGKGIKVHDQLAPRTLPVLGSRGQLEQVFLNLLLDAEQAASEAREKSMSVASSLLARRVLVEIVYHTRSTEFQKPGSLDGHHSSAGALGLGVCSGIVQSHGGDLRSLRVSPTEARFEVEIPYLETKATIAPPTGMETRALARQLTVLLVEPDLRLQKQIVQMLSDRGDRVVPVVSGEEAADLAVRLRFDLTLCAVRLPGLNWVEFFERVRRQVGTFVLLTEGYDSDLARAFQGGEGFVLAKPVEAAELDKIRRAAEDKHAVRT